MNAVFDRWLICLSFFSFAASAAEPTLSSNDLPRFPPVTAKDALQTFQVRKGFHLELVAAEPEVVSPVALSFDEDGRMYVVEMVDYSERRDEVPHLGRIRLLEDKDGDGVYETSTIFATNLAWPTAVFCYNGGVFVAATPDILYLKDTNGDGKADVRETVFTGFAEGLERINVQAMLNTFLWGLDNRIHGATSGNGGVIRQMRHPEAEPIDLHGRDFVIEPRRLTLRAEAGGGQHGLSFDDAGRRFACNNSDHIRLFMYDEVYAARNRFYPMPAPLVSIAIDGPAAEVYRISPEEPWRVIRTRWRVAGLVPGPIEGGGRASGYFTGATGTTIYRGSAYPREFLGNAFVADCGGNLIHRKLLVPDGVELKAQRAPDEQTVEFAASKDTWFRPVQFANAPDGTLYVIDIYREIIEHPWSLPDGIKKLVDLNSGNDRGRIYRIAPDGFKPGARPHLGKASTKELVSTLENPNGWHRDTVARLLYERQDAAAGPLLAELYDNSKSSLARMHCLYAMDGLSVLTQARVVKAFQDPDAIVREHAIKLSERFLKTGEPSSQLLAGLNALAQDPSSMVRYQLAFTLGEVKLAEKIPALAEIARHDVGSFWTRAAILSSLAEGAGDLFTRLSVDPSFSMSNLGQEFLAELIGLVGARNDHAEVQRVFDFIGTVVDPAVRFAMLRALGDGLKSNGGYEGVADKFKIEFASAARLVSDSQAAEPARLQAVRLLGLTSFTDSGALLLGLLDSAQSQPLQSAVVSSLNRFNDPRLGPELIKTWDRLSPQVRSDVLAALLARPDRALDLLKAIQSGSIQATVLGTPQLKFLRNNRDPEVRRLAAQVLAAEAPARRQTVIDGFMPALQLKGNPVTGRKIYQERCSSCHRLGGEGHALGPDLVTVKSAGKEKLLVNILDPNREVRPEYVSYVVETSDGESLVGLIANETPATITVRQAYGKEDILARAHVQRMRSQGQSLMPEGLEAGLQLQDLADLLEYIETADPPSR